MCVVRVTIFYTLPIDCVYPRMGHFRDLSVPMSLRWRHNERHSVSNNQPHDCFLNGLFRRRSKKTSKLRVTGLCVGNSPPGTGEFPAQRASYVENVSIWWRHHVKWTINQTHWNGPTKRDSYNSPCLRTIGMIFGNNEVRLETTKREKL